MMMLMMMPYFKLGYEYQFDMISGPVKEYIFFVFNFLENNHKRYRFRYSWMTNGKGKKNFMSNKPDVTKKKVFEEIIAQ